MLFDRDRNRRPTLLERVLGDQKPYFHPLRNQIRNNSYLLHGPGPVIFGPRGITLDLFDTSQPSIPLSPDWEEQIVQISAGEELTIRGFVTVIRNKEAAHFDPQPTRKLDATKAITYKEFGNDLRHEKLLIAIGEYVLNRVQELVFPSAPDLTNWGADLIKLGRYDEAIGRFQEALKYDPAFAASWYYCGVALGHLGRFEEAIEWFTEAVKAEPNFPEAYYDWSVALGSLGRHEEAISKLNEALRYRENFPYGWYGLGVALSKLGKIAEAMEKFKVAVSLRPDFPEARYSLGVLFNSLGQREEALENFKTATDIYPKYADAWYDWGMTLNLLGQYEPSAEKFRVARELGCSRSLSFPGVWETVVLTEWTDNESPRRGSIADAYVLRGYGDITGASSWPKGADCPYYGLLVEIDADNEVIRQILVDGRYLVVVSRIYDPDQIPHPSWNGHLQEWLTLRGMSSNAAERFVAELEGLRRGEVLHELRDLLRNSRPTIVQQAPSYQ